MHSMKGITWVVLALQLSAVYGSNTYHDEALLKTYVFLSQQLRLQTLKARSDLHAQVVAISSKLAEKALQINSARSEAMVSVSSAVANASDMALKAKTIMTPALKAQTKEPYTDPLQTLFGEVTLDHGTGYSGSVGELMVTSPGVYILEYKVQTADYKGFTSKIEVTDSGGSSKYTFTTYHDWEVSPLFEMLKLDAGDKITMYSMYAVATWSNPTSVVPGAATQFSLRYLGRDVPLGYTTAAPLNDYTTFWWL